MTDVEYDDRHAAVRDLAAAALVDAVTDEERGQVETHLAECASCRAETDALRETVAALGATQRTTRPAALENSVLAAVGAPAAPAPAPPAKAVPGRGGRPRGATWLLRAAVAVLVVALGVAGVRIWRDHQRASATQQVLAVVAAPDAHVRPLSVPDAHASIVMSANGNSAALLATSLPMPPGDEVYQAWVVAPDGTMTSAGTFRPDPSGRVAAMLDGDVRGAAGFVVTVEPAGGSAHPTMPPVAEVRV